jgi:hypothetical protein
MSVNLKHLHNKALVQAVCAYFTSDQYPTMAQTQERFALTYHTVSAMLRKDVSAEVLQSRKNANKSRAKTGSKNPRFGVRLHTTNIINGYRMRWQDGLYVQEHRLVLMEALGLTVWPEGWQVHHINSDRLDNRVDNLCVATVKGHACMHGQKLELLPLWEKEQFGTSVLQEIVATLRTAG